MHTKVNELFVHLCVRDAAAALEFYKQAFGAEELFRLVEPSGRIAHAEFRLGNYTVMLAEEFPGLGVLCPDSLGGTSTTIHLHVDDADAGIRTAVEAGATLRFPAEDRFYGERSGRVRDPYGHEWALGHTIEKLSVEEMQRRYTAMFEK